MHGPYHQLGGPGPRRHGISRWIIREIGCFDGRDVAHGNAPQADDEVMDIEDIVGGSDAVPVAVQSTPLVGIHHIAGKLEGRPHAPASPNP